jgi:hypothetical protein
MKVAKYVLYFVYRQKKVYFFAIAYISADIAQVAVEGMSAAISPLMSLFILIIS